MSSFFSHRFPEPPPQARPPRRTKHGARFRVYAQKRKGIKQTESQQLQKPTLTAVTLRQRRALASLPSQTECSRSTVIPGVTATFAKDALASEPHLGRQLKNFKRRTENIKLRNQAVSAQRKVGCNPFLEAKLKTAKLWSCRRDKDAAEYLRSMEVLARWKLLDCSLARDTDMVFPRGKDYRLLRLRDEPAFAQVIELVARAHMVVFDDVDDLLAVEPEIAKWLACIFSLPLPDEDTDSLRQCLFNNS